MKATWLGQSGYLLEGGGVRLAIDPYLSDAVERAQGLKRLVPPPCTVAELAPDVLLITHDHLDHLRPGHGARGDGRVSRLPPRRPGERQDAWRADRPGGRAARAARCRAVRPTRRCRGHRHARPPQRSCRGRPAGSRRRRSPLVQRRHPV
ncbi:MAG: hypothetical protein FJ221_14250 [Lentisphaerae bacterium]|nr:hypothetical protein [Lentisphaerota bacterium]